MFLPSLKSEHFARRWLTSVLLRLSRFQLALTKDAALLLPVLFSFKSYPPENPVALEMDTDARNGEY